MKMLSLKNVLLLCAMIVLLSSCSLLHTHKLAIQQGNIIEPANVTHLHKGMTEAEVKAIMGPPELTTLFTPNRLDYIYTLQNPYQARIQNQVTCLFVNGRLTAVQQSE